MGKFTVNYFTTVAAGVTTAILYRAERNDYCVEYVLHFQYQGYEMCYNFVYHIDMPSCPQSLISGPEADGTQGYECVRLNASLGAPCGLRKSSAVGLCHHPSATPSAMTLRLHVFHYNCNVTLFGMMCQLLSTSCCSKKRFSTLCYGVTFTF